MVWSLPIFTCAREREVTDIGTSRIRIERVHVGPGEIAIHADEQ